jgi:putative permease
VIILIPFLKEIPTFFSYKFASYKETLSNIANPILEKFFKEHSEIIQENINSIFLEALRLIAATSFSLLENGWLLARFITLALLSPIISFYFIKDWEIIKKNIKTLIPLKYKKNISEISYNMDTALSHYVRGQILICGILSIYYSTSLACTSLSFGFSIGLLTGFFIFIPYLGFCSSLLISCFLSVSEWGTMSHLIIILSIYIIGYTIEAFVLTPWIIGKNTGLHPIWILFSIFSGAALFGFFGVLLALPSATVIAALWRYGRTYYIKSAFYRE